MRHGRATGRRRGDVEPIQMTSAECEVVIATGEAFEIVGVSRDGAEWSVTCRLAGRRRLRVLTLPDGVVASRDRLLSAMQSWLEEEHNPAPEVRLDRVGRSLLFRQAASV
jgi:hypothetical protein